MNTHRINHLVNFIKAERIKKKRSGFFGMAVIFGFLVPLISFIAQFVFPEVHRPGIEFNVYESALKTYAPIITGFFLVILILLNASKIAQLDHKNGGWQLMDLLPVRKSAIFFGKFCLVLISNAILIGTFFAALLIFGAISLQFMEIPDEMTTHIPWKYLGLLFIRILTASFLLTAFQYVLSVLLPSYIWSLFIGLLLFITSSILAGRNIFFPFNPVQIISHTGSNPSGGQMNNWFLYTELFSLIAGSCLLWFGFWWYRSKGFYRAFLKNNLARLVSFILLMVFITGAYFYLTPNMQEPHHQTVITGTLKSDYDVKYAILRRPTINDTIAVIPIENGKFYFKTEENLPLTSYLLIFQDYFKLDVVMGNKDSIYADIKFQNGATDIQLSGTRIAENNRKSDEFGWNFTTYQIENGVNIDQFEKLQKDLLDLTRDELANIKSFRSVDNFTFRDDYKNILEREVIVEHLLFKEKLEKNVKAKFPEKEITWHKGWKKIESSITQNDLQLLDNAKYIDYLTFQFLKKDTTEIAENIKILNGLKNLPKGEFKDKILYSKLMEALENANTKDERDTLAQYINQIQTPRFQQYLSHFYNNLLNISKYKPALEILATHINGQQVKLSDLKGKWVLIDFWATWCGPCLYESPYFEKMALKYKNENIAFVALSLDQRKGKWETEAKSKSKIVKQWHANDLQKVSKDYSIQGIPRFVMIDPEGNFYQSKMTRPSEAAFEMILRKALGLKDLE